jgi:hypothetical protein
MPQTVGLVLIVWQNVPRHFSWRFRVKKWNGAFAVIGVLCMGVCGGIARGDSPVTPFLNATTNAVIYADLSNIDMDAVAAWQQKLQAAGPQDEQSQRMARRSQAQMIKAKQWVTDFKSAGGKDVYLVAQIGGMFMGQPGEVVAPLGAGANADALANVFIPGGNEPPPPPPQPGDPNSPPPPGPGMGRPAPATAVIGTSLVYSTASMVESLKTAQPAPRPDLEAALAAGNSPVRIAISPSSIKSLPIFKMMAMRMSGGGPGGPGGQAGPTVPFSEPQWDAVTWVLISIVPPPTENGTVIFQCKDADSANALAGLLNQKLTDWQNDPQAQKNFGDQLPKIAATVKPVVNGSQVTMSMDQATVDAVAQRAAKMRMGMRPPRPPGGGMPPGGAGEPGDQGPPGGPGGGDNGPPPGQ